MPTSPSPRARRAGWGLLALALAAGVLGAYVGGVGMRKPRPSDAIVTFGDSLTEGAESIGRAWPELLAARLRESGQRRTAVVNAGIGGNRLLRDGMGPSGLDRFERDVLARRGARWVILLEGINDLGFAGRVEPGAPPTAEQLIEAYRQLIERAHLAGMKIYGGTLLPFEGATSPGYFTPEKELVRQAVNAWIRSSGSFDGVIDFDAALRDPRHPTRLRPDADDGDHLHLNAAGHRAMAEAIDLRLFRDGG